MAKKHKHKWKYQINVKKKVIVLVILGVSLFVGLGYALILSPLGLGGTIEFGKVDPTYLYDVIKDATPEGYANRYTGSHQDSIDPTKSTEDIYYYTALTDVEAEAILNKNNVVFANTCWQMIRTTDTGGVRMIYNGEPDITVVNGQNQYDCSNNRNLYHIGDVKTTKDLSGTFRYASSYTATTSGDTTTYTLVNSRTVTVNSTYATTRIANIAANYPYTCANSSTTCTNRDFYKVESQNNGTIANVYESTDRSAIGVVSFNLYSEDEERMITIDRTPSGSGYMYGDTYSSQNTLFTSRQLTYTHSIPTNTSLIIGDGYQDNQDGTYTLTNQQTVTKSIWESNYENYEGKWICYNNNYSINNVGTCTADKLAYIVGVAQDKYGCITGFMTVGKSRNGLNLVDTITIHRSELINYLPGDSYYVNINNHPEYVYTCDNTETVCTEENLRFMKGISSFTGSGISHDYDYLYYPNYKYGNGLVYENGVFKLQNAQELETALDPNARYNYKYICKTRGATECSEVGYVYEYSMHHFIKWTNPSILSATDLIDSMQKKNVNDSNIKKSIDAWYESKIKNTAFESRVDDTIYCNDRSYSTETGKTFEDSTWNPIGGNNSSLYYKGYDTTHTDLSCANTTDQFSVSNNAAKLTYPVALITSPELALLGNNNLRKVSSNYWTMTPNIITGNGNIINGCKRDGTIWSMPLYFANPPMSEVQDELDHFGARPVISLRQGAQYKSGTGTVTDPYVVR